MIISSAFLSLPTFAVTATYLRQSDTHAQALLENSLKFLTAETKAVDPASGYPAEGWNPNLRGFTQLTSIGEWLEVQSMIAAGQIKADNLNPQQALDALTLATDSLLVDQQNPELSNLGLLSNFIPFRGNSRSGPARDNLRKSRLTKAFGEQKANTLWQSLIAAGWLSQTDSPDAAHVERKKINRKNMTGPLADFADDDNAKQLFDILNEPMANIIYGDNANLSASVAKTIGALLDPAIIENPRAAALRAKLELFLTRQQDGYNHMYDPQEGLFYFGYTSDNIYVGWGNPWKRAHMAYFVNEFRGPQQFVELRFKIPADATANQFFKIHSYTTQAGENKFVACAWDGSAFQLMGLSLFMGEMNQPAWKQLLLNVVAAETDYSTKNKLPGFLSESYTGNHYTGDVGIPELCASGGHRIEYAPSLYSLGVAYQINPAATEKFLADHWDGITPLFTDHGPSEGYNTRDQKIIEQQTSAHTLSLIIGLAGTAPENMQRYLDSKELRNNFPTGAGTQELLAEPTELKDQPLTLPFHNQPVACSGMLLKVDCTPAANAVLIINLRRQKPGSLPVEITCPLDASGQASIPLPATPALMHVREIEIKSRDQQPLTINHLTLSPIQE